MKSKLIALIILCLPSLGVCDTKMSAFPVTTTLAGTDVIPVVTTPGSTPTNNIITLQNLTSAINPILNQNSLQIGSTFYVSSAAVNGQLNLFPPASVVGFNLVGTQNPGSGSVAAPSGMNVTAAKGETFSGASQTAGGNGGILNLITGAGGDNSSSNGTANILYHAGNGGTFNLFTGAGGAGSVGVAKGGSGGSFSMNAGSGGTSAFAGAGAGGSITLFPGFGGITSTTTAYGSSGRGGSLFLDSGSGGNANTIAGSSSGNGGDILLVSGSGGSGVQGFNYFGNGGNSGNISIDVGTPGNGVSTGTFGIISIGTNAVNPSSIIDIGQITSTTTVLGLSNLGTVVISTSLALPQATFSGSGNLSFAQNGNATSYQVVGSSSTPTTGHTAIWSSSWSLVDGGTGGGAGGTPGGTAGQLQYNSAGSFAGASSIVTASSITIISSASFTTNGVQNAPAAFLDIFNNIAVSGTPLFSVGSPNQNNQFVIKDQQPLSLIFYGARTGEILLGQSDSHNITDSQSAQQLLTLWNGGEMDFQTANLGDGGTTKDSFIFKPAEVTEVTISTFSVSISTELVVISPITGPYETTFSTSSVIFHVAISTNGHFISNGPSPIISSCGSTPNGSVVGTDKAGVITVGGGSVTACTLTFANSYGIGCTVSCTTSDSITTATPDVVSTPTTMTMGFSATIGGGTVNYNCEGIGPTCR